MALNISIEELMRVHPKFADLPTDWVSNALGRHIPEQTPYVEATYLNSLKLFNVPTKEDSEIVSMWANMKTHMNNGSFSEADLREWVICALNLRGVRGTSRPLISDVLPRVGLVYDTNPDTGPIPAFGPAAATPQGLRLMTDGTAENNESKARAICYICCVYLRLFTKPADHIVKALPAIKQAYGKFYGSRSTLLSTFSPPQTWADRIKLGLSYSKIVASTIGYRLAIAEGVLPVTDGNHGLCRYLLFQHLGMIGMHIYKMSTALINHLNKVTPRQFLTWINNRESEEAVAAIDSIRTTLDDPKRANKTYHWKYAKMTDGTYFLDLAIGRNKYLGALLAKLTKSFGLSGTDEYADPENIAVLRTVSPFTNESATEDARVIVAMYEQLENTTSHGTGWDGTPPAKKFRAS